MFDDRGATLFFLLSFGSDPKAFVFAQHLHVVFSSLGSKP